MAYDPKLGFAFSFDEDELAANREGRLTRDQAILLGNAAGAYRRLGRRNVVLTLLIVAVVAVMGVFVLGRTPGTTATSYYILAGALVLFVIVMALATRRSRRSADVMAQATVHRAEGELDIRSNASGWTAIIGGARFQLDAERMNALLEGDRYRVNYLLTGRNVTPLSLERVE